MNVHRETAQSCHERTGEKTLYIFFIFGLSSLQITKQIWKEWPPIFFKVSFWYTLRLSIRHGLLELLDIGFFGTAGRCVLVNVD